MRLLIDESAAEELEGPLRASGIAARHIRPLDLVGAEDPIVLALARAEYDAIVTKDRYRKGDPRDAALRGMHAGLRIVELRFTGKAPRFDTGTTAEQLDLLLRHRERIEQMIDPGSPLRKLVLNGSTGTITKELDINDVAAEISRLGL